MGSGLFETKNGDRNYRTTGYRKTYFLWHALLRLIQGSQPVAFYAGGTVYLFYDNDVWCPTTITPLEFPLPRQVKSLATEYVPFLFVLVDQDISKSEPRPDLVYGDAIFPVQASSPDPSRFGLWAKTRDAAIWGLPLWTQEELNMAFGLQPYYLHFKAELENGLRSEGTLSKAVRVALETLEKWSNKINVIEGEENQTDEIDMKNIDDALKVLLHAAVQDWGPVARDVFKSIFRPGILVQNTADAIAKVAYDDIVKFCKSFQADFTLPDENISHRLIVVRPDFPPTEDPEAYERQRDEWKLEYRSEQIAQEMERKLEEMRDERPADLYEYFHSSPQASKLAAHVFENIGHRALRQDSRKRTCSVRDAGCREQIG